MGSLKKNGLKTLDYCIIGPQRTGTSWLDKVLRQNPNVCLPLNVKETFFFDRDYSKGIEFYSNYYVTCKNSLASLEVAPTYFSNNEVAKRLKKHFPDLQPIFIIRNPIDQAYSLYLHHKSKGRVTGNLMEAIKAMPEILEGARYKTNILIWENVFGKQQLIVLHYSDLANNPHHFYASFLKVLKLPSQALPEIMNKKYGEATNPRFKSLAKVAAKSATVLRKMNLHFLAEIGKKIGLKAVFKGAKLSTINSEERAFLVDKLTEDINFLQENYAES